MRFPIGFNTETDFFFEQNIKQQTGCQGADMTIFMITVAVLAYAALWYFVIRCSKIIKRTDDAGQSSRDIIKNQKL